MAKPVWSGFLVFGLVSIPLRVFPATTSHDISFNLLHKKTKSRIKLQYYCPECEKVVPRDELVRGYEYEKGKYVILEEEDLEKIKPQSSRSLEINEFINLDEVDPVYYEKTYYLGPGEGGEKAFHLFTQALRETKRAGIGKLLMRDHEYLALIRANDAGLVAHLMFYEDEIRKNENRVAKNSKVPEKQLQLAKDIVENLTVPFRPSEYKNDYVKKLGQLIESRVTGRKLRIVPSKPRPHVEDLMAALQKSVQRSLKKQSRGREKTA
jgi:DNA end-binding protein Ku